MQEGLVWLGRGVECARLAVEGLMGVMGLCVSVCACWAATHVGLVGGSTQAGDLYVLHIVRLVLGVWLLAVAPSRPVLLCQSAWLPTGLCGLGACAPHAPPPPPPPNPHPQKEKKTKEVAVLQSVLQSMFSLAELLLTWQRLLVWGIWVSVCQAASAVMACATGVGHWQRSCVRSCCCVPHCVSGWIVHSCVEWTEKGQPPAAFVWSGPTKIQKTKMVA